LHSRLLPGVAGYQNVGRLTAARATQRVKLRRLPFSGVQFRRAPRPPTRTRPLGQVQILRAVAALSVVLFHIQGELRNRGLFDPFPDLTRRAISGHLPSAASRCAGHNGSGPEPPPKAARDLRRPQGRMESRHRGGARADQGRGAGQTKSETSQLEISDDHSKKKLQYPSGSRSSPVASGERRSIQEKRNDGKCGRQDFRTTNSIVSGALFRLRYEQCCSLYPVTFFPNATLFSTSNSRRVRAAAVYDPLGPASKQEASVGVT
jgi:hypothetical protein